MFSVSVVVTAEAEGRLLHPTLRGLAAAIDSLIATGESAELIVVAYSASEETRAQLERWRTASESAFPVHVWEMPDAGAGAARNAGIDAAKGEFVAIVDGAELVSSDYLVVALRELRATSKPAVFHPETVIGFGTNPYRWHVRASSSPSVGFRDVIAMIHWPRAVVASRSLLLANPYPELRPDGPYGQEDWAWQLQTLAAGVVHDVAPGTVLFDRAPGNPGGGPAGDDGILPPVDLSTLRSKFAGDVAVSASESQLGRKRLAPHAVARRLFQRWVKARSLSFQHFLRHTYIGWRGYRQVHDMSVPALAKSREELEPHFRAGAALEPALSWKLNSYEHLDEYRPHNDGYGTVLDEILTDLGDRSGALVMAPWILGFGGADTVAINYVKALELSKEYHGRTSVVLTYMPERTRREFVPEGTPVVQVSEAVRVLAPERQHRLFAQAVVWARPRVVIGVNCFDLVQALGVHSRPVCDGRDVRLTIFAFDRIGAGYPTQPITDDPNRSFLESIGGLITDNTVTKRHVDQLLGLESSFMHVHPQPAMDQTPVLNTQTAAWRDETFSSERPFRLLWPHRIDGEKRPDVLVAIAEALKAQGLPVSIEVYGSVVLGGAPEDILDEFKRAGISYHGPYTGGMTSLPTGEYHAMLLTSAWEGMPLGLVQSLLLSLPVVATAVGGIPDVIEDGVTGLLVAGPEDIDGFVKAVEQLMASREERRRIIVDGHSFAVRRHSWEGFQALLADEFGLVYR